MEKITDEYCKKIFITLIIISKKVRFNELYKNLPKYGARMSKPTLVEHLNHLVKKEIIQREEKNEQNVSFTINWKRFQQVATKEMSEVLSRREKNEKRFKSKSLDEQVIYATGIETIGNSSTSDSKSLTPLTRKTNCKTIMPTPWFAASLTSTAHGS